MTRPTLVEASDRWLLGLQGREVTQVRFDYAFTVAIWEPEEYFEIRIGQPFTFEPVNGGPVTLDPAGEPGAMSPVLAISRAIVSRVVAYKDGRLELEFEDGSSIRVPPGADYEAWQIVGPDGLLFVSLPGGGLAEWLPEQTK